MKKLVYASVIVVLAAALWHSCSRSTGIRTSTATLQFSPHVEAFTSGQISRQGPIYLILSKDVDTAVVNRKKLAKALSIKPDVKGEFMLDNNKTIVFRPAGEFDRDKTYTITADLGTLAGATGEGTKFTFSFSTYPLALRGYVTEFVNTPGKEYSYDVTVVLRSPDSEDAETVEKYLKLSEKAKVKWEHSDDGKKHTLTLLDVEAVKRPRHIRLYADKKSGAQKGDILTVRIPAQGEFGLYDIRYVSEPERYIEATFTTALDGKQELDGIVEMEGSNWYARPQVIGNAVRLYPAATSGIVTVRFGKGLKSLAGNKLGEMLTLEVETGSDGPDLKLLGDGVIMPTEGMLRLPFRAVYLRGVVVRVIRIPEQNIGQFLQANTLSESSELKRVGRLVARQTIFFDPHSSDLSSWGTYAVDLSEIIDPEPGALYRVELSYNRDLSVYPCDDDHEALSEDQIRAADELKFMEELEEFDEGGYYYYYDEYDWWDYYYGDRDDPCTGSYYRNKKASRNILATDLGVIVKGEGSGDLVVMVHDLTTTEAVADAEITAYNYQNQVIGKGRTDGLGKARVETKGTAYYVTASNGVQRTYVRMERGEALSLSTFDVSGEVVRKGLKGFIYGERGVWRPGDTLFVSFMLADRDAILPPDHPVVLELFNPLGQQYLRRVASQGTLGIYTFELPTDPDVPTGSWEIKVTVGGVDFTKNIRIEAIKPNRLKIDLNFDEETLPANKAFTASLHTEWLQGATARNLKYEINVTVNAVKTTFAKFSNYVFDDPQKSFSPSEAKFSSGTVNDNGDGRPSGTIYASKNNSPGMLMATFDTKVYEESGDFSIDVLRKQVSVFNRFVGIHSPQDGKKQLNTGQDHRFDLVTLDNDGNPVPDVKVDVEIYRVGWYWWWASAEERLANYFSNSYNSPKKSISTKTDRSGKGYFDISFDDSDWGTYYIKVKDATGGHSSGLMAYFDWPYLQGARGADGNVAASLLTLKTDKEEYTTGEKIHLTFPSAEGSRALISIENGSRVIGVEQHVCGKGETTISIKADADMMPNAYLHVTLIQPHDHTLNDLPIRLYGVAPVTVTSPESRLRPQIVMKDEVSPESRYEIGVSEQKGRPMAYTLAVVDEGLLDLTRFQTPDPWKAFNAKEALGVRTWDMYNYVMGAYGGRLEQVFSVGGDDALNPGPKAIVNRFKPVVTFIGPFTLKKGERQKHVLEMPNYNGRVRVMVVAGDGQAYGYTEKSVLVRRPVMLLGTLPRVIGVNETMAVPATVFATEKGIGDVKVSIECSGNMSVEGVKTSTLNFDREGDQQAFFTVRTGGTPGAGRVVLTADSKKGKITYETDIEIRSVSRAVTAVTSATVQAGQEWSGSVRVPGQDGTNNIALEVSTVPPVNLTSRLGYLIGYPHGCIEQITSKGFPQLYLQNFATLTAEQQRVTGQAVREVISKQRSYQTAEGGFAYWPSGTSTNAWGTIYATHFQLEAEAAGYMVPEGMKTAALNNLQLVARNWKPASDSYLGSEVVTQAYRLYVLALAGRAETGAMNRLKERTDLSNSARWFLAAAYAQSGRANTAKEILGTVQPIDSYSYGEYDYTYGSPLRDRSVQLIALILSGEDSQAADLSREISAELSKDDWMSTQTTAYALMAMSKFYGKYATGDGMELSYTVGSEKGKMKSSKAMQTEDILKGVSGNQTATLKNTGKSTLFIRWSAEGVPHAGEETAYENGLRLNVSYTDLNGSPVEVDRIEQGTNFRAVVTVANPTSKAYNNIVLTQIFPSGWEILSTRFASEGASDSFPAGVSYQDIRDDRVYSYVDRFPAGREVKITINLAAVYEGSFHLPPVYAEAMYDNTIKANTAGHKTEVFK